MLTEDNHIKTQKSDISKLDNNIAVKKDNKITQSDQSHQSLVNNYYSANLETELLPPVSRWTSIGGMVTVGLVGIAVILAATIKYDVTVKAEANIRPEGEIKLVQTSREGRIKSIQAQENQTIKKGDVIAYLDDQELQNKNQKLITNIHKSQLQLRQIDAQLNNLEQQIIAETEKSDRAIASSVAELERTQTEFNQQQLTNQAQVQQATAELNIAQKELAKAQAQLQSVQANLKSSEASLASAITKRDRYKKILSSGAISQERFEEAQLSVQQNQQNLESQKAEVLSQKQTIERQKQEIKLAQAKLSSAQAVLNPSDTVIEIAQQGINREKANKNATIASHLKEKEILIQQRIEIEKQITQEKQQLQQITQEIDQSILRATADGTILKLNLRNQHQVVNPQDAIAEIAPNSSNLIVKAQINTQDRDRLELGQTVKLKVKACPYPDYGILSGTVTAISADTMQEENSKQKYYSAEILPTAETLVKRKKICQLRSGMEATADIITKAETPLQFLLRKARLITDW